MSSFHLTRKLRRHSGRKTPRLSKGIKVSELVENCLEPQEHWDDWLDYRDGTRAMRDAHFRKYHYRKSEKVLNSISCRKQKLERYKYFR